MASIAVQFTIEDYAKWRSVFDSGDAIRAGAGIGNVHIYRDADRGGEVMVVADCADVGKARALLSSPQLAEKFREGGVKNGPRIHVLE